MALGSRTSDDRGLRRRLAIQRHRSLLTSFFDTGVADSSLYTYVATDFRSPRFPTLAKALLRLGSAIGVISRIKQLAAFANHELGTPLTYSRHEALLVVRATEGILSLVGDLRTG